ncbi:hypothetical protein BKA56DRAFT_617450 [Ilyonectria sp. MPI-CAGE-AT-0026]|nr:hypothetical protein BKA56DRAFT_617450 [Ilyonectria sp. MPI-CAGE-AT-0026]
MANPTAEMPMPGDQEQQDLLEVLEKHDSLYQLSLEMPKLAKSLEALPLPRHVDISSTLGAIAKDEDDDWKMATLLHSMDRSAIRAIIRGTVAFDTFKEEAKWLEIPGEAEGKVPGVYVIGLSRRDHHGQFLNILETEKLIRGLQNYIDGYRALDRHRCRVQLQVATQGNLTPQDKERISWVFKVDGFPGVVLPHGSIPEAKFVESDDDVMNIEALIKSLERRCDVTLDPTKEIRQRQSPIYVGCSTNLRVSTSDDSLKDLSGLNKPLALTVSILSALDLPVNLTVQVALRIWEPDQLPVAEQLVATLASSLVHQHGFNDTEAGGTAGSTVTASSLQAARELIMCHNQTMSDNVEKTIAEMEKRLEFIKTLESLMDSVPKLEAEIVAMTKELADQTSDLSWGHLNELMDEIEAEMEQRYSDAHKKAWDLRVLSKINDIYKREFGDLDPVGRDGQQDTGGNASEQDTGGNAREQDTSGNTSEQGEQHTDN